MSDDLEDLLADFLERRESGENITPERFAEVHPGRREELLAALARWRSAEAAFPTNVATSTRIGPWVLGAPLGRGGMGRVFEVEHATAPDGQRRALKLLGRDALFDARAVARIEREGAVLRDLDHPGIVAVHDVGAGEHGPWLVMDAIEGRSLAEVLTAAREAADPCGAAQVTPLDAPTHTALAPAAAAHTEATAPLAEPWRGIAVLGAHIADALAAAHAAGLLHRDLKPSNVMLRPDGQPVVIDFGLAVVEGSHTLTGTGDIVGTPQYMAPEQVRGERADARTDVWGIGALLYELCTLRAPVAERDSLAAMERLRRRRPPLLARDARVPRELARVIDRALAFRRARRCATAAAMADDLRRVARGERAVSRAVGLIERLEDGARARPRRAAALAVGLLAGCAAVGGAWLAKSRDTAPGPPTVDRATLLAEVLHASTLAHLERDDDGLVAAAAAFERLGDTARAALVRGLAGVAPFPLDCPERQVALIARGASALREGRQADALPPLQAAALDVEGWALPLVLLGEAARDLGDTATAEREWTSATRLVTDSPDLCRRLGKLRSDLRDNDGAAVAYRRAFELAPQDWRNAYELARALAKLRDAAVRPEALERIDVALALAPEPKPIGLWVVKAALLDGTGQREGAREMYRELLARDPKHASSWFNLGYSHDVDCQLSEAREAYTKAIELQPKNVNAHVALAKIATGSEQATCEQCAASIAAHPELVDPEAVVEHLSAALRADDARTDWLPMLAVEYAQKADRSVELGEVLSELLDARKEVDAGTVRLERALRELRRR